MILRRALLVSACVVATRWLSPAAESERPFLLECGLSGLTSLRCPGDPHQAEFIRDGGVLGEVVLRYRHASGKIMEVSTGAPTAERETLDRKSALLSVRYQLAGGLQLTEDFAFRGDALVWTLGLSNESEAAVEIGDLAVPLPMNTVYPKAFAEDTEETFTRRVFKHAFISGHGSFLFWLPVGGVGPHLVLTPRSGTKLEFFTETGSDYAHGGGRYTVFVHSAVSGATETRGTWRQEHTGLTLPPGGQATYGFELRWARDLDGVRDVLYESGGFDIRIVPGMVLPTELHALLSLRTRNPIESVRPEYPARTSVRHIGDRPGGHKLYRVKFSRLGENLLTVRYGGGRQLFLEFFITQPLETLIRKRAAFIVSNQQHRDPSKWFDGLFSLWDVRLPEGRNLLGPENLAGQHPYAVSGSDDPSNSKCVFLSEKNVAFPDAREVAALEYFVEHFVWSKHQRTEKESPHPYGIYGCPSWHACRFSETGLGSGGHGQERMWRTFDYTTYFALYYNLYRIAKQDPELTRYLDAGGYLERAFGTARAYFTVPHNIQMGQGWSFQGWCDWAYKIGNFHEKYLLGIIEALEAEDRSAKADWLRTEWEKKVKYFLYDDPYPYVSEMPVDSTAYESSYAIAKYALTRKLEPDEKLWRDKNSGEWYSHPTIDTRVHRDFLERQLLANIACRGWLETSYYHLGSDFRALGSSGYTLSYMSQMGGWAILDHGLHFAEKPADLIRLGYASLLSSWALVNAGTAESGWGFWYPGPRHDGAAAWGFLPRKFGAEWNPGARAIPRGPWPVDGEIDHGLTAGVETARTVVFDDPVFGRFAFGGEVATRDGTIRVVPRDGVRQRLDMLCGGARLHCNLNRDGFLADTVIRCREDLAQLHFSLENRGTGAHVTELLLRGLPPGRYRASADGEALQPLRVGDDRALTLEIPVPEGAESLEVILARE